MASSRLQQCQGPIGLTLHDFTAYAVATCRLYQCQGPLGPTLDGNFWASSIWASSLTFERRYLGKLLAELFSAKSNPFEDHLKPFYWI